MPGVDVPHSKNGGQPIQERRSQKENQREGVDSEPSTQRRDGVLAINHRHAPNGSVGSAGRPAPGHRRHQCQGQPEGSGAGCDGGSTGEAGAGPPAHRCCCQGHHHQDNKENTDTARPESPSPSQLVKRFGGK